MSESELTPGTPPTPTPDPVALPKADGSPGVFEGSQIESVQPPEPRITTAARQRESMPGESLVTRTAITENSKDIGFFRALWNYIWNSSTKSMDQARLNLAATDYLKAHSNEVDSIMEGIATHVGSQEPNIIHAFAAALKELAQGKIEGLQGKFGDFCTAVRRSMDAVLTEGAQTPSNITSDDIKHAADLVGKLKSVIEFSPSALSLHSLVQKLPADQITPDLIGFCKDFPEQAQELAKRQDLRRISFQGTDDSNGLTLNYKDRSYDPEILDLITPELFEGADRDALIEDLLKNPATSSYFWVDGIRRSDMPHISLPNGVEILSNFGGGNSEYCTETGKPHDDPKYSIEYLKYMLNKFREAYGDTDKAVKAFKVFVQNSTGVGNTFAHIVDPIIRKGNERMGTAQGPLYCLFVCETLQMCRSQPSMQMDENFNIRFNVSACRFGEGVQQFNEGKEGSFELPKDTIFGITINSYIPAAINDTMDQCGQGGKQTTTFGMIESFSNKSSS
jgi:hypothetical protein